MEVKVPKHTSDWIAFKDFLTELIGITTELLQSLHGKRIDHEYQRVFFKFLERFHLNFVAVRKIWKEFLINSKFKHPIYLLLRSLISDTITMLYLADGLKFHKSTLEPVETEFRNRYIRVSNSYFTRIEREIEKQIAAKKLRPKERERFLSTEREFYPDHFHEGKKVRVKKIANLDPGSLTKHIERSEFKKLAGIYVYYFYFSQFEHFTVKTEELFSNKREGEFEMLIGATSYLIRGLLVNVAIMKVDKAMSNKLSNLIRRFKEQFVK